MKIDTAKFTYRDITPISILKYEIDDISSLKDIEGYLFGLEFDEDPMVTNVLVEIKNTRKHFLYSIVEEFGKYRIITN